MMIYQEISNLLKEKNVDLDDNVHQVLTKIKGSILPGVKSFLKKNWSQEKNYLLDPTKDFKDPTIEDSFILEIENEDGPFRVTQDRAFSICPSCKSRIFPDFDFCPYCGYDVKDINREPLKLDRDLRPRLGRREPVRIRRGVGDGLGRRDGLGPHYPYCVSETIVEDEEVKVTEQDVKNAKREIGKYLP